MITVYTARNAAAFSRARTQAHLVGLPFEQIGPMKAEVTFQDADKVLSIVKRAGGTVSRPLRSREMTRAEML